MEINKHLVVGLPGTGKTTFLAALWQVVESAEVPDSLIVSEVTGIRDHLNDIRSTWLNCQELERTKIPAEKQVSFRLKDPQTNIEVELSLPDLSGETFEQQWVTRQLTQEFVEFSSECSGILLFLHPHTIKEPNKIDSTVETITAAIEGSNDNPDSTGPQSDNTDQQPNQAITPATAIEPWTPAQTPTQVKLVDILQFLRSRQCMDRALPIVVIVSAWDIITTSQTPAKWVDTRLPLLNQFLCSDAETTPFAVFGISAQGGDLSKAGELQHHVKPSDRIIVTAPDGTTTHDITAPLKWLLGQ